MWVCSFPGNTPSCSGSAMRISMEAFNSLTVLRLVALQMEVDEISESRKAWWNFSRGCPS